MYIVRIYIRLRRSWISKNKIYKSCIKYEYYSIVQSIKRLQAVYQCYKIQTLLTKSLQKFAIQMY